MRARWPPEERAADEDSWERPADPVEQGVAGLSTDWSVPWSDLMMVLFVLFVVLYCFERAERDVFARGPVSTAGAVAPFEEPSFEPAPGKRLLEGSRRIVEAAGLDDVELALEGDRSLHIRVHGAGYFDLGKADLKPDTERFLRELARLLARERSTVQVVGHTDAFPISSPEFPTNWELSAGRATRVTRFLIEQGGLAPERFTVRAHSMYRPVTPDTSPEAMARNRRVEIIITPPQSEESRS